MKDNNSTALLGHQLIFETIVHFDSSEYCCASFWSRDLASCYDRLQRLRRVGSVIVEVVQLRPCIQDYHGVPIEMHDNLGNGGMSIEGRYSDSFHMPLGSDNETINQSIRPSTIKVQC